MDKIVIPIVLILTVSCINTKDKTNILTKEFSRTIRLIDTAKLTYDSLLTYYNSAKEDSLIEKHLSNKIIHLQDSISHFLEVSYELYQEGNISEQDYILAIDSLKTQLRPLHNYKVTLDSIKNTKNKPSPKEIKDS